MQKTLRRLLAVLLVMSITLCCGITASANYYGYDEIVDEDFEDDIDLVEGYYYIQSAYCEKYFDVINAKTSGGARLKLWNRETSAEHSQLFYLSPVGDYWKITVVDSGKVLAVKKASKEQEALIVQANYKRKKSQLWKIEENTNGTFSFINWYSGLAMDIYRAETANGTQVIQFPFGSYKQNQQFNLIPLSNNNGGGNNGGGSSNKSPFETEYTYRVVYNYSGYSFESNTVPVPDKYYLVRTEKIDANTVLDMICSQVYNLNSEEWKNLVKLAREGRNDGSVNSLVKETYVSFSLKYDYDAIYIYSTETYVYSLGR
jgi:hypothetical protein